MQFEMLWEAGQERLVREQRERLGERYVGARDGYIAGNIATGKAKAKPGFRGPWYAQAASDATPQSPAQYRATLARLGALAPGAVRTH